MKKDTFSPSMLSGVKLTDDGQEIILKSSTAGNFIVKKEKIREVLLSSGTGMLGGNKAIIIINGEQGELVRSGNLKFDHAKSIKDWIESRINIKTQNKENPPAAHIAENVQINNDSAYKDQPKNKISGKKKGCLGCLGAFFALMIISSLVGSCSKDKSSIAPYSPSSGVVTDTTYTSLAPAEQLAKQKAAAEEHKANKEKAKAEVLKILNSMSSHTDQVEKVTWYTPWSGENYPAESAIYWYAAKKDNRVWLRAKIVHYSSGINWVFWDKAIFSTPEKNWTYQIKNVFAGQSGGGKSTQIVMGGKYETLDANFEELKPGYQLLANSKGPNVIRLEGKEYKFDYKPDNTDLSHIKTGLYLYEQLSLIGNTLE